MNPALAHPIYTSRHGFDWDRLALVFLVMAAIAMALTFDDYGLGWDDYTHTEYADLLIALFKSGFRDRRAFEFVNLYYYGGGFDVVAALLHKILPISLFETRRLLGGIVGFIGLAVSWRLGRRVSGPFGGAMTLAMLALCPTFYGHMFINPKDMPFAVAMVVFLLGIVRIIEDYPFPTPRTLVILGLGAGLALGTRIMGGFQIVVALIAALPLIVTDMQRNGLRDGSARLARVLYALVPAIVLGIIVMGLLWPWSVDEPGNLFRAAEYFSHFFEKPWRELYNGALIDVPNMPWTYIPTMFGLHLPEMLLALVLLGTGLIIAALASRQIDTRRKSILMVVLLAAFLPLVVTMIKRPALYNGIRHFIFVIPPMAVIAGFGATWLREAIHRINRPNWRRTAQSAALAALCAGLVVPLTAMVRLHPYQYVHFNYLAGTARAAQSRFMLDYWGIAFKQASDELRAAIDERKLIPSEDRPWKVAVCGPQRPAQVALGNGFTIGWDSRGADFAMVLTEFYCRELNAPVLVEIKRDDVVFARVYDIRGLNISSLLTIPAP